MKDRFYEDYDIGQKYTTKSIRIDELSIIEFAKTYDPQHHHLDDAAARKTAFGGLVASGWQTAALTMKLFVESDFTPECGFIGAGFDELSWPMPVRPNDEIYAIIEVINARISKSRPTHGILKVKTYTYNQHNDIVQKQIVNLLVPRNPFVG
jgi:acyl dehydratase